MCNVFQITGSCLLFWPGWSNARACEFLIICHPQKHISWGKFCIFLIFRSWDKEISLFGLFFRIFTRGNFSTQIWSYLKIRSIYQLGVNGNSQRIMFWIRLVNFVFISIQFAAVKNFTFPPTPKSLFLEIMHNIRGSCAAVHDDRFTNFIFS